MRTPSRIVVALVASLQQFAEAARRNAQVLREAQAAIGRCLCAEYGVVQPILDWLIALVSKLEVAR
jgi:hypothetical protein